ncbi:MAG: hypothetical protein JSS66_04990 [Armatimonadetes bacterium]|nr:hypothetical protein [Armatimonadota bacterium]
MGKARHALLSDFGDTNKNAGALLRLEAAFARLRQATMFHDDDGSSGLVSYGTTDPVGFGVFDGVLEEQDHDCPGFESVTGNWYPRFLGPPSMEGWGVWYYNAWSSWDVDPQPGNTEGADYALRLTYDRPVRHTGSATFANVPYFRHARWVSLHNASGSSYHPNTWMQVVLPKSTFEGCMLFAADTGLPRDIRAYAYTELVQSKTGSTWNSITLPSTNAQPMVLDMEIEASGDDYIIYLKTPSALGWPAGYYWHIALYWGTHEELSLAPIAGIVGSPIIFNPELAYIWTKKNFFRQDVGVQFGWTLDSVYGTDTFLKALNRTHFKYMDGGFSDPAVPAKYQLVDWPPAEPAGVAGALTGYMRDVRPGAARCVRLLARTQKSDDESPDVDPLVAIGPEVTAEFWPEDWDDSPYFPPVAEGYESLGRLVVVRAPGDLYDIVDQRDAGFRALLENTGDEDDANTDEAASLNCKFYIAWLSQDVHSFAMPPMNDTDAVERLLPAIYRALVELRLFAVDTPLSGLAYGLLPPGASLPGSILSGLSQMRDVTTTSSKAFLAALKSPITDALLPTTGYRSFEFDADGRSVISDIASLPPSTVMARLDANVLSVTNEKLSTANEFEVFLDESDQCDAISLDSAADKLTNDYTLRLKLLDASENLFQKDLFVTASKFFLSQEEYNRRVNASLSTTGYFTYDTLDYMNEFRLHGYAGVVPDLRMRDYKKILTRVVSPEDDTRVTEAQFRKNLENQGYSQEQIDDAVAAFLAAGGEFLIVDLRQYDNKFAALQELGVCVSQLASFDAPYWFNNLNGFFGFKLGKDPDDVVPPEIARSDSFTIAPANLDPSVLEQFGTQDARPADPSLDRTDNTGNEYPLATPGFAVRFVTTETSGIAGVKLRLRRSAFDATAGFDDTPGTGLKAYLYTSTDDLPGTLIASGGTFRYADMPDDSFIEAAFPLQANLAADKVYWLVLAKTEDTTWGLVSLDAKQEPSTAVAWHYDEGRDPANWVRMSGAPWVAAYNSDVSVLSPVFVLDTDEHFDDFLLYSKTSSKTVLSGTVDRFSFALSTLLQSENPTERLLNAAGKRVRLRIVEDAGGFPSDTEVTTAVGPELRTLTTDYAEYKFETATSVSAGTYWVELYFDERPQGGVVRLARTGLTTGMLARKNPDGTWVPESSDVWLDFYNQSYQILGAFNRDSPNVFEHLPPPNDQRTYTGVNQQSALYKVETFWAYTSRQLSEPAELAIYPRAFFNSNTSEWEYAPRTKDIYVKVKLWVDGRIVEKDIIKLESAPGWRARFWVQAAGNETELDTAEAADVDTIVETIDYENYEGDNDELGQHWNARFEGTFRPLYDGEVYTLVLEANTGARVYFEDMETPVIDTWDSPVYVPVSYVIPGPLDQSTAYSFVVEHYRADTTERLKLYWYPTSNPVPELIGPDSALVVPPEPVSLGADLADGIAYLAVAKTQEELETFTDGAPPGDRLVIRSS